MAIATGEIAFATRRAFKIDVERCDKCGGRMKLRALVMTAGSIEPRLASRLSERAGERPQFLQALVHERSAWRADIA